MLKVAKTNIILSLKLRNPNYCKAYSNTSIYTHLRNRPFKANHVLQFSNYLQASENYSQSQQQLSQAIPENPGAFFYNQPNQALDKLADPFLYNPEEDKEYFLHFLNQFVEQNYSVSFEEDELKETIELKSSIMPEPLRESQLEDDSEELVLTKANIPFGVTGKTIKQLAQTTMKEQHAKSKQFNLNQYLQAYVDTMVYKRETENISKALKIATNYLKRIVQGKLVKNPDIFNPLLKVLAARDKDPKSIAAFIEENSCRGVEPNIQSFAALLHSCDSDTTTNAQIEEYIEDMEKNGFQIENLRTKCKLSKAQQEGISRVLEKVSRDPFVPKSYTKTMFQSPLLAGLNKPNTMKEEAQFSQHKEPLIDYEQLKNRFQRQIEIEKIGYQSIKSISNVNDSKDNTTLKNKIKQLEKEWEHKLTIAFNQAVMEVKIKSTPRNTLSIYPYLAILKPEQYVQLMMKEINTVSKSSEHFSLSAIQIYKDLACKVLNIYKAQVKVENGVTEKLEEIYNEYLKYYNDPALRAQYNPREYWSLLQSKLPNGATLVQEDISWPYSNLVAVGKFLYDIMEKNIRIKLEDSSVEAKVFTSHYRYYGYKKRLEIKPNSELSRLYRNAHMEELEFPLAEVPMICPPIPWINTKLGAYLTLPINFVRLQEQAVHQISYIDNHPQEKLHSIFDALNILGSCPWNINKPMLEIVKEIFQKGDPSVSIPCHPSTLPPFVPLENEEATIQNLIKQKKLRNKEEAELYSLWCNTLYQLSMAEHYKDEMFWLPHNLDFRGRVYPITPFLSHIGCDLTRSILLFAEGKPLGPNGLNWLKLHLVSLEGQMKKASIKERLAYAEEILPEVFDSANNPLDGRKWWTKADDPLQALACCKEIVNVIQSGDPENYISHFPIHQDGSCNGLQHYSALGRDELGAEHVNLSDKERPGDVYTGVANLVEDARRKDAADESSPYYAIANKLEGVINRKVVKQTVMTTVYGVTQYGARQQIKKQLSALELDDDCVKEGSRYLQSQTFASISTIFNSARKLQNWLTISAKIISKYCDRPVRWVTPLGLPVVQHYHMAKQIGLPYLGLEKTFKVTYENKTSIYTKPNSRKQANAFPPNYIHSLDSTHMMLTALYCWRAGVNFVSVHDCFWTHAQDVETMNKICREQFVSLHSQPLLEQLSEYFITDFGFPPEDLSTHDFHNKIFTAKSNINEFFKVLPSKGNFCLNEVLKSKYFFS